MERRLKHIGEASREQAEALSRRDEAFADRLDQELERTTFAKEHWHREHGL